MKILITGGAGFIGFHTAKHFINQGHDVYIVDNFNSTLYDSKIKFDRISQIKGVDRQRLSITDYQGLQRRFHRTKPDMVIHLAAMAGVRFSMGNDSLYIDNNIVGTQNVINCCEEFGVENVIYASSSCVMNGNPIPWNEEVPLNPPLSPYGYTKIANEAQFNISKIKNAVGLRFFTVYGPWGRPDMALFDFTKKILNHNTIEVYNHGNMIRDFTYVDDIVHGIDLVSKNMTERDIYCIGRGEMIDLMYFINCIENELGRGAKIKKVDKHPADVTHTASNTIKIQKLGYKPITSIEDGIKNFVDWYKEYYQCG